MTTYHIENSMCYLRTIINHIKLVISISIIFISTNNFASSFELTTKEVEKSAHSGNAYAQFLMGFTREANDSPVHNYKEALMWYEKSSEQGFSPSTYNLAALYFNGTSVSKNKKKAFELYSKAARSGYPPAVYILGVFHDTGDMVDVNRIKAFQYFYDAASKGDAMAQVNLGVYYVRGFATKQDFSEAYAWFSVAAKKNNQTSITYKNKLTKMLDAKTLKIAIEKAFEYEDKYYLSDSDFENTYIKPKASIN